MTTRIIFLVILVILGLMIYTFIDPTSSNLFPKCPFLRLTGFQCPGCGSQRAIHQLLNGNIANAFAFNPLMVILMPYVLIASIFEFTSMKNLYPRFQTVLFGYRTIYFLCGIIMAFWIARNF